MASDPPARIPIKHDEHCAKHIGRTADGRQFFLTTPFEPAVGGEPGCEFIALFLFDSNGTFLEAIIDNLGPRSSVDREAASRLYEARLASLGRVEQGGIVVAPFSVHRFNVDFGLIPRAPEDDDDDDFCAVEMQPGNYMAFFPPWDGEYDT